MTRRWVLGVLYAFAAASLVGCAINRESAHVSPDTDLSRLKRLHVVKFEPDGRGIDGLIAAELSKRGYQVSTGEEGMTPQGADAIVTYRDKWRWDISMYMLELTIQLREPGSLRLLATGTSHHTSLSRRTPEQMVAEVVSNILSSPAKSSRGGT